MADTVPAWLVTFGGIARDRAVALALDPAGNPIVAGGFEADLTGVVQVSSAGLSDILVVSFDELTGAVRWTMAGRGSQFDQVTDVSWNGASSVSITGFTTAGLQLGGAQIDAAGAGADAFLARFTVVDTQPTPEFAVSTNGSGMEDAWGAFEGGVVAGTFYDGSLAVGPTEIDSTSASTRGWVAKLSANRQMPVLWSLPFGGTTASDRVVVASVAGQAPAMAVAGSFTGTLAVPGGPSLTSRGGTDGMLLRLNTTNGALVGAPSAVGGAGDDAVVAAAADSTATVWLAGYVEGSATFGATVSAPIGRRDAFVYRSSGDSTLWRAGAPDHDTEVTGLAFGPDDQPVLVGLFDGELALGGDTLVSRGGLDVFVCKLARDGTVLWATSFGGPEDEPPSDVGVTPDGAIIVAGGFSATADFGGATRTSAGQTDWFVAAFTPP